MSDWTRGGPSLRGSTGTGVWRTALRALAVVAASVLPAAAGAATEEEKDDAREASPSLVEEVEAIASIPARRPPAATHVTVVAPGTLRRSVSPAIDDALRGIGGFRLFRRTSSVVANPTTMGAALRGGGPSGTGRAAVTLDGLPIDDPFGGWVMWSRVPKLLLGGALVSRPGSPLGASDKGLTGSIALEPRPLGGRFAAFEARYGTNATLEAGAALVEPLSQGHLSVEARRFQTDGYDVVRDEDRGAIDVPAFSETSLVDAAWEGALSSRLGMTARVNAFADERGNGTPLTGNETDGVTASVGFELGDGRGETDWRVTLYASDQSFANRFSAQAADRGSERPALDQRAVPSSSQGVIVSKVSRDVQSVFYVKRVSGETEERYFFVGDPESGDFTRERRAGGEQLLTGAVVRFEWTAIELTAGVDHWSDRDGARVERELDGGALLRDESFDERTRLLPNFRVAYVGFPGGVAPESATRYRPWVAASVSARPPTLNELYRPFRVRNEITEANGALEPEIRSGVDAGVVYRPGASSRTQLTLSGYWNVVSDAIANVTIAPGPGQVAPCGFVPAGGACRQRQNLGRADVAGLELELETDVSRRWRGTFSAQLTDAEVRRAPESSSLEGRRLAQVPRQSAALAISYGGDRFSGRLAARYEGEQFEDDLNLRTLDPFVTVDARLEWRLSRGWSIFGGVENAFDAEIETGLSPDGIVATGVPRQLHVGVRIDTGD